MSYEFTHYIFFSLRGQWLCAYNLIYVGGKNRKRNLWNLKNGASYGRVVCYKIALSSRSQHTKLKCWFVKSSFGFFNSVAGGTYIRIVHGENIMPWMLCGRTSVYSYNRTFIFPLLEADYFC